VFVLRLQGKELPYDNFAFRESRKSDEGTSDLCTLYHVDAFVIPVNRSYSPDNQEQRCLCIELVGSRFLRRMVRIISVSINI
jgi:hypothetical protein